MIRISSIARQVDGSLRVIPNGVCGSYRGMWCFDGQVYYQDKAVQLQAKIDAYNDYIKLFCINPLAVY